MAKVCIAKRKSKVLHVGLALGSECRVGSGFIAKVQIGLGINPPVVWNKLDARKRFQPLSNSVG